MRWRGARSQKGSGIFGKILWAAFIALAIYLGYQYFSNPENKTSTRPAADILGK
jgi:TRAP-type C4-dicarboxylate transport system permease small subunit